MGVRILISLLISAILFAVSLATHQQWLPHVSDFSYKVYGFIPGWHISLLVECLIFSLIPFRVALLSSRWKSPRLKHFFWALLIDLVVLWLVIWGVFYLCFILCQEETQWLPSNIVGEPYPFFGSSLIFVGSFAPLLMLLFTKSRETTLDENQSQI